MNVPLLKIILVAGARPNFMKIAPILECMKKYPDRLEPRLIHTGQHYDKNMSRVFFEDLGMPEPDVYLGVGSASHAVQTAKVMTEFEKILEKEKPDWVLVVGDVNSTLACSLVAVKMDIPVAHVEAGLRSFDRRMPEEINRILTDQISDRLFITSEEAVTNLNNEGISTDKIFFVGNAMIESLIKAKKKISESSILTQMKLKPKSYSLLTLHRPSNVDTHDTFYNIMKAIQNIGEQLPVIFPAHPRTQKQMASFSMDTDNIVMIDPVGYHDFLALEMNAGLVLTDSGGLQEETTYFGVPCLTIRENTERPVTVTEGTNVLVGTDPDKILKEAETIFAGNFKKGTVPKYWDEHVSARIVDVFLNGKVSENT